ncbi:agamous-like MADS-box protein AGL62 [Rosa chinensis]|uniref:agamous-like MADS-box protein AGL62 n=1 Tax=Rosa chinensis TaxID=74649 RepID=UPI000D096D18|nr:agamous-like MADS-box protein AGL62 [Rosa chinensis]
MGLKKIEIKKITDKESLKVTYSKRRKGLFRKADDFCSKTGAQIAIITFSPGMKQLTFGQPSVESIIDRYELCEQSSNVDDKEILDKDGHHGDGEDLDLGARRENRRGVGLDELKQYATRVEEQRNKLAWQIEERRRRESSTIDLLGVNCWSTSEDLKLFGIKVGEKMELEEIKRRESCTKDFLSIVGIK